MDTFNYCSWKDEIRQKLVTVYESINVEGLIRVLFYLDEEDSAYKENSIIAPAWRTLKYTLNSDVAFKKYSERLIEDTKRAEKDVAFRSTMKTIYSEMMKVSEDPLPDDTFQDFDVARITNIDDVSRASGFIGFARAWEIIPQSSRLQILEVIPTIISNRQTISCLDEIVSVVNKRGGNIVMVALAAITLSYDAIRNIYRWWQGQITGKRCCKNIVDSAFAIGAGIAGGVGGAALCSIGGPVGIVVGGVIGGIISCQAMNFLIDRLTQTLFGIPKDEALENAYNFLGVKMTASNSEINLAFRERCLKYHPDKGGRSDDFITLQINMGVIKAARGELYS